MSNDLYYLTYRKHVLNQSFIQTAAIQKQVGRSAAKNDMFDGCAAH